ncbi:MAG: ComF family protein [Hyphomicrobiales bacterium]|nr:ComF family protein [Rickettsiales bacterium]MCP5361357.1 ComF family protein [Hyphomicrobiales bacterium]
MPHRMLALATKCVDILLPPRCLACGEHVQAQGELCSTCWHNIHFLADPLCQKCGTPLPSAELPSMHCGACLAETPPYDVARSALRYDEHSKHLITRYKYHDRTLTTERFAEWMIRTGESLLADADYITPVPLHYRRLISRRYNQSALLAQAIARRTRIPYLPMLLERTRYTIPQAGLSRNARQQNLKGAFRLHRSHTDTPFKGKKIVLVDDVLTTGETVSACTRALNRTGAEVRVLTLARRVLD